MSARARRREAGAPYLLDTHIWFWYVLGSDRLPGALRAALDAASGERWLSPVSVWELGVLERRGRVRLVGGCGPGRTRRSAAFRSARRG